MCLIIDNRQVINAFIQEITYSDLAAVVKRKDSMEFLHDIIPKKIKYSEYLAMMEEEKNEEDDLF